MEDCNHQSQKNKITNVIYNNDTSSYKDITYNKKEQTIKLFDKFDEYIISIGKDVIRNYLLKTVVYKLKNRFIEVQINQSNLYICFLKAVKQFDLQNKLKIRKGYENTAYRVHNIPFVALGAFLLWFGWFGFNAGSALAANGLAAHAFLTTAVSSASAMLTWMLIDVIKDGKPTLVGASTGLVIGLVAITPGAGFVPIWSSFLIGGLVSPICCFTISVIKSKLKIDDALDAFGCHGIGGIWGGIATGIFAKSSINPVARWDGLIFGEYRLFVAQIVGIVVTAAVAIVGTLICLWLVKRITPIRVSDKEERIGLDISEQGESAYPTFNGLDS